MPTPLRPHAAPAATLKLKRTPEIAQPDPRVTPIPVRQDAQFPRVSGYDILSVVGYGGMGIVYEARHRELNRRVALKMLRGEALADPEYRERLRVEAEAIARLQHPNVIQVFEVGTVEALAGELYPNPFLALEFIDGGSLAQHTHSPQQPRPAAKTVETLARAAHAAHQLGVVHRDLKPANVLLTADGTPKIADFGIAKRIDEGEARGLTRDGVVMGTPEYMAPEQLHGQTASPTIDVYALGVILYELLTGRVPFQGSSFADTMLLTMYQEPVPPRRLQPAVPRDIETVCLKCLDKNPAKRYATAAELADDLAAWADGRPIRARALGARERVTRWARRNPAVAALSALALVLAAGGLAGVLWQWSEARANADQARDNEREAQRNAGRAEEAAAAAIRNADKERWERYRISAFAASSALRLHDTTSARLALDAAPPDHRDWVWKLLSAQLDQSAAVWPVGPCEGVAFSGDGRVAVLGDPRSGRACACDLTARTARRAPTLPPDRGWPYLNRDGSVAAFPCVGGGLAVYDTDTWRERDGFRGYAGEVRAIAFAADGDELLTLADDGTARRWDARTGAERRAVRLDNAAQQPMAVDPAWRVVAARGRDGAALWDADTGRELVRLRGHVGPLRRFVFGPDGTRVISLEEYPTNTLRLWEVPSGRLLATLDGHENTVQQVVFSPDGKLLASCGWDRTVRLWNLAAPATRGQLEPQRVWDAHTGRVDWIAFSADGRRVVSTSSDRTLRYWDVDANAPIAVLKGHTNAVFGAAFSPDGRHITSVSSDKTARVWDVADLEADYALRGHAKFVYSVAVRADGERVASAAWDGTARIWNPTTRAELRRLPHTGGADSYAVSAVAYAPDGRHVATLCRDRLVRLWDAETGAEVHRWEVPTGVWCDGRLAFGPDGRALAVGSIDTNVHLIDLRTRERVPLKGHTSPVRDVAFSPDGKWLASASEVPDRSVRVWEVATGRQLHVLNGHAEAAYAVAWHPNGRLLASGGHDGSVQLWDAAAGAPVGGPLKQGANAHAVCFSPDGKLLTVGCADNLIRIWNVQTRDLLAELSGHRNYVHSLAFSPDGTRLVSGSGDHTIRVWDSVPRNERRR